MLSFFSKRSSHEESPAPRAGVRVDSGQRRRLALEDPVEEVRQAAVRGLDDQEALLEVVLTGRHLDTRAMALARIVGHERRLALAQDSSLPMALRAQALVGVQADKRLCALYRPDAPETFKAAVLDALGDAADEEFWAEVARRDPDANVRARAIRRIGSERICVSLHRGESDPELRRILAERVNTPEALVQLAESLGSSAELGRVVERIHETDALVQVVRRVRCLETRLAALARIESPAAVRDIAAADVPPQVAAAALARLTDDKSRGIVAMRSPIEEIRAEALRLITDEDVLSRLEDEAPAPEIRWLAGRRMGVVPMQAAAEIRSGATLRRLIEQETDPEVSAWLVGRVPDEGTLRVLGGTSFPGTVAALRRLKEQEGPFGLRFMAVPGRPYAMSLFPVTRRQLREALGRDAAGKGADDLPATGVTPEQALRFCERLAARGTGIFRLPSFEEWRHVCMAGDENWLDVAAGQFSWAEALLGTQRLAFACKGPRGASLAWPNPWGFLDMVGNVAVWVDDSPRQWMRLAADDPLAIGGDPHDPASFAVAAGVSWADSRVRKEALARLVARSAISSWAGDKVGFRVVWEQEKALAAGPTPKFKVVLTAQIAPGFTKEHVIAAIRASWPDAGKRAETWYRVAPAVVLPAADYTEARRVKRLLESCGACVHLAPV
jgi:Uncharacterized conserved protein